MAIQRLSTGVPGMDPLIEGGIPKTFAVILSGSPGSGKTVFASQFLYEGLTKGEHGIYLSFSEPADQFIVGMNRFGMDFGKYREEKAFEFLDFSSINREGLADALEEFLATVKGIHAERIVVDSFTAIGQAFSDRNDSRIAADVIFGKMMKSIGATILLTVEVPFGETTLGSGIEEFVSDGIIKLEHSDDNASPFLVRVIKMRATKIDREIHRAMIDRNGMKIFPKQSLRLTYPTSDERIPTGVPGLDERIAGGFLRGTSTGLTGASGVGKTTFCLQFLVEGVAEKSEPGIFCTLEETADEIRRMAKHFGLDILELEKNGLKILALNPELDNPDAIIAELVEQIKKTKARRLVIDSLSVFQHNYADEIYLITKQLVSLAREYELTVIMTILTGQETSRLDITQYGLSSLFQNLVILLYVEAEARMKRTMILLKLRGTPHDDSLLEVSIGENGLRVVGPFDRYEGVLTGFARPREDFERMEREIAEQQNLDRRHRRAKFLAQRKASADALRSSTSRKRAGQRGRSKAAKND